MMAEPLKLLMISPEGAKTEIVQANLDRAMPGPVRVAYADKFAEALELVANSKVDAILLDMDLPDTQGLDSLITLHLHLPNIPVIAFMKEWDLPRAVAIVRSGGQDCLSLAQVLTPDLGRIILLAIERHGIRSAKTMHVEQLQYSEARFRLLINENADPIFVVNTNRIIRFANPAAAVMFGKSREELVGSFFVNAKPVDGATLQLIRSQGTLWAEMRVVETVWQGENVYLITLRDMTTHHHLVNALQSGYERYREFIAASMEGIWRTQLSRPLAITMPVELQAEALLSETLISEANDAMAQMYGYAKAADFIGKHAELDFNPSDEVNRSMYRAFVTNGYRLSDAISHELDRFGNSKIFLNNMYGIVREGYLIGMWGTQRDVTEPERTRLELNRVEQQESYQRQRAQALADCAAALNSTLHYEQVLDRILDNVGRVVPHDAVSIFLIRDGRAHLARGHGYDLPQLQEHLTQLKPDIEQIPVFQQMIREGKPLLITDTAKNEQWVDMTQGWVRSYVGAPLRARDRTLGFLNLDSTTANFFTPRHAEDLEAFAALAATALENARLHARAEQRAEEFAALYDLMRELGMQRDLDSLLKVLVERAMSLLHASCGALALYLPDSKELEQRVMLGARTGALPRRIRMGQGLFGRVAQARHMLIVDDYRAWEHRLPVGESDDVSAALAVPMVFGGGLEGVLAVHELGDTTRQYTAADAQLLTLIATQAAALVHNARLHQETEKRAQQLALLYDAGLTLNSVLDTESQLDFLTRIAMRSLRAEIAAFFQFEKSTNELVLRYTAGYTHEHPYKYADRIALDAESGIEAWVARERIPATIPDVRFDPRFRNSGEQIVSGVWVPVEHDNVLLGVFAVCASSPQAFDSYDERLLVLYASQAAVALENARLYKLALQAD